MWPLTPSSLECLVSRHVYIRSLPWPNSMMPNGLFNIWYPRPFLYFTLEDSWACWPSSTLPPGMDWTHPFGGGETTSAWRQGGIASADPSHDGNLTKTRDVLGLCGALTLEELKSVLPLCWLRLSNENEVVRGAKYHSVLIAFLLGHRVFWRLTLGFLGRGLALIQSSNNSGTIQVS